MFNPHEVPWNDHKKTYVFPLFSIENTFSPIWFQPMIFHDSTEALFVAFLGDEEVLLLRLAPGSGSWLVVWGIQSETYRWKKSKNSCTSQVVNMANIPWFCWGFNHPRWCRISSIHSTIQVGCLIPAIYGAIADLFIGFTALMIIYTRIQLYIGDEWDIQLVSLSLSPYLYIYIWVVNHLLTENGQRKCNDVFNWKKS